MKPTGCHCGTDKLCPQHFRAEDYVIGAYVVRNPYLIYPEEYNDPVHAGVIYRVTGVRDHNHYPGHILLQIDKNPNWMHHAWVLPDEFTNQVRKSRKES